MDDQSADSFLDFACDRLLESWVDGVPLPTEVLVAERPELEAKIRQLARDTQVTAVQCPRDHRRIGQYEILDVLGRGGMGTVYLARQPGLGRIVALKILPEYARASERARTRFHREAQVLGRLRHPHVVTIFEVIDEDGLAAYAMEWIDGPSLDSWMTELRPVTEWCRIAIAILRALQVVHAAGLVHRDITPRNVLLRTDGSPVVTDFGIALDQSATAMTRTGEFLGTAAYAPPEQLQGQKDAMGPWVDTYAVGAILREALAGHGEGLARDLQIVTEKATAADPKDRYSDAAAFADDLQCVLDFRPIRARKPAWTRRAWRSLRRHRAVLTAVILTAVASLLAAVHWTRENARIAKLPAQRTEAIRKARLSLLDADIGARLFDTISGNPPRPWSAPTLDFQSAIEHYDRARTLGGEDRELELEAAMVRIAAAPPVDRPSLAASLDLGRELPVTLAWVGSGRLPSLETATEPDRRSLGLIAYLTGHYREALDAWEGQDLRTADGYFVDAAVGDVLLSEQRPQLAYPRLLRALEQYPDSAHLILCAADAACAVGDLPVAQRLLTDFESRGLTDRYSIARRIEADILAAEGQLDAAISLYATLPLTPSGLAAFAAALHLQGRSAEALRIQARLVLDVPGVRAYRDKFLGDLQAWWTGLSERHVQALVVELLGSKDALLATVLPLIIPSEPNLEFAELSPTLPIGETPFTRSGVPVNALLLTERIDRMQRESDTRVAPWARPFLAKALYTMDRVGLGRTLAPRIEGLWRGKRSVLRLVQFIAASVTILAGTGAEAQVLGVQRITTAQGGFATTLATNDYFGAGAEWLGDLNGDGRPEVAVGSPTRDDPSLPTPDQAGVLFILSLNPDGTVFAETQITATQIGYDPATDGFFSAFYFLSNLGDLDGDGTLELAASAHWRQGDAPTPNQPRGGVYILSLSASLTLAGVREIAENHGGFVGPLGDLDHFGYGLGAIGDVNGDGITDLAVGALDDNGGLDAGAVYILFLNASGTVMAQQKISNSAGGLSPMTLQSGDLFGYGITSVGDLDGNGVPDIAVAAPGDDDGGMDRGAFYVLFLNANGTVLTQTKVSDTQGGLGPLLQDFDGLITVRAGPDLNNDGRAEIVAGFLARHGTGSALVLSLTTAGSVAAAVEIGPNTPGFLGQLGAGGQGGYQARLIPDLNGDGHPDMLYPERLSDAAGSNTGALYVLLLDDLFPVVYPGTAEDFVLATAINGLSCTTGPGASVKSAAAGDLLNLCLGSPSGTFSGAPLLLVAQIMPSGTPLSNPLPPPLQNLWIFPFTIIFDGTTSIGPLGSNFVVGQSGPVYVFQVPAGLSGSQVAFQSAVIAPGIAANGVFALTEAHVIEFQ